MMDEETGQGTAAGEHPAVTLDYVAQLIQDRFGTVDGHLAEIQTKMVDYGDQLDEHDQRLSQVEQIVEVHTSADRRVVAKFEVTVALVEVREEHGHGEQPPEKEPGRRGRSSRW